MNFQRIVIALFVLLVAGLAGSLYMNWKTLTQLRTVKAFVEGAVFADAEDAHAAGNVESQHAPGLIAQQPGIDRGDALDHRACSQAH